MLLENLEKRLEVGADMLIAESFGETLAGNALQVVDVVDGESHAEGDEDLRGMM